MSTKKTAQGDLEVAVLLDRFMRRLHGALRQKAPSFDTERIGPGGAMILLTVADAGTLSMQGVARALVRDKSQITREVASLERKGLLARHAAPTDSRVSLIRLTALGQQVVDVHRTVIADTIGEVLGPLQDAERAHLHALLARALDGSGP